MQVQVLSTCIINVNVIIIVITLRTRTGIQVCGSDTSFGGRESGPTVSGSPSLVLWEIHQVLGREE